MKKTFCLARATLLLLVMMLTTMTALAQNPTTYDELVIAINNVTDGGTVTLGGNVDLGSLGSSSGIETQTGANFTLDLNGHVLKGSSTNAVILVNDFTTLVITDGAGGGSIINEHTNNGYAVMNSGTVTISGGTFSGRSGLCNSSGGTMTVSGGTISCSVSGNGAAIENNATLTVSGGTLIGTGGNSAGILNGGTANVGACTIKGCGNGILNTSTLNLTALPTFGSGTDANDSDIRLYTPYKIITFSADIAAAPANPIVVSYYDLAPPVTFTSGYATHCAGINPADMFTYYGGATTNIIATLDGDEVQFMLIPIPYIDENGQKQTLDDYNVIGCSQTFYSDWYVVTRDVTLSSLSFSDDAYIILCDGAKLTVKDNNGRGDITGNDRSITIYGQSAGTGAIEAGAIKVNTSKATGANFTLYGGNLDINRLEACNIYIYDGSITATTANNKTAIYSGALTRIYGGNVTVTANGCNGIESAGEMVDIRGGQVTVTATGDNCSGIQADAGEIGISGGQVTANATGTNSYGMRGYASSEIYLGWTNATDFITASSYYVENGEIYIAGGKTMINGSEILSGTIYDVNNGNPIGDLSAIAGKKLQPYIEWSGTGAKDDPWIIEYPCQLDLLAQRVNDGTDYSGKYFKLGADIAYSHTTDWNDATSTENNYTAIGYFDSQDPGDYDDDINCYFCGTFDGDGHTISGIRIYKAGTSDTDECQGVFGKIGAGGAVKNLTLSDSRITGYSQIGGVVGYNEGSTDNCHSLASVVVSSNGNVNSGTIGGIVGDCCSNITDCTSEATITGGDGASACYYLGGIAGNVYSGGCINNCTSEATITVGNGASNCFAFGGIAGQINMGSIINCTSSATITVGDGVSDCDAFGGISGYNFNCTLTGNLVIGATISGSRSLGAIMGEIYNNGITLANNYYSGCTLNGTPTSSNIGCGSHGDINSNDGAVPAFILSETEAVPAMNENDKVVFRRSFTKDVASTVCLPFAIDATQAGAAGKFYTFAGVDKSGEKWEVIMQETDTSVDPPVGNEVSTLAANTPYLFKPAATGPVLFYGTAPASVSAGETSDTEGWTFRGTYEKRQWDDTHNQDEIGRIYGFAAQSYDGGSYNVSPGDFVKAMAGASIAPFRAYLQFTPSSSARRRGAADNEVLPSRMSVRLVNADGTAAAIGTIDTKTGEVRFDSDAWFTLDGRRLHSAPSTRGIYIKNGKKVVIK